MKTAKRAAPKKKLQFAVRLDPDLAKAIGDDQAQILKRTRIRLTVSDVIRRALAQHYGLAP
jgi:hypothetical protein